MKYRLLLFLLFCCHISFGQVSDDFSDGNFTTSPAWIGDTSDFDASANKLQLYAPTAGTSMLTTPQSMLGATTWEFLVHFNFNPSGSNLAKVFLASDQSDLSGSLNGYFVLIGNTKDEISLYKKTGKSESYVIDGTDDVVDVATVNVRIKVIRTADGTWSLFHDVTGGTAFIKEGNSSLETTHTTTSHFGVWCKYTSTRKNKIYFDDFSVSTALKVANVEIQNARSIQVTFNQNVTLASAETSAYYTMNNGATITAAVRHITNHNEVILTSSTLTTQAYQLIIANVMDEATATALATAHVANLNYKQLEVASISTVSNTQLKIKFNDNIDKITAETIANYSVDHSLGMPTTAVKDTEDTTAVRLTFATPFTALTHYTIIINNIENTNKNSKITDNTQKLFQYVIPLIVTQVTVLSSTSIELTFNLSLNKLSAELASNYSINHSIGQPSNVVLNQANDKKVIITVGTAFTQNSFRITMNGIKDIGLNAIVANFTIAFSYSPLAILNVAVTSKTTIVVTFNQKVDSTTANFISNYSLNNGIGYAAIAEVDDMNTAKVNLSFAKSMVNYTYTLTVHNVKNSTKNSTALALTHAVVAQYSTTYRAIVVNEIFADPNPVIGLPTGEYLELYNSANVTINIKDFVIDKKVLPNYNLAANGFVILTKVASMANYTRFGEVIGLSGTWSLSNEGEALVLKDNLDHIVDSVSYDLTYYKDDVKKGGGYSLEQINPARACSFVGNWQASNHANGGTPGTVNSVNDTTADTQKPNVVSLDVVSATSLRVTYDEPMNLATLHTKANYTLDHDATVAHVVADGVGGMKVLITTSHPLTSGTTYKVTVSDVMDCAGNRLDTNTKSKYYDVVPPKIQRLLVRSQNTLIVYFDEPLHESIAETVSNFNLDQGNGHPTSATWVVADSAVHLVFIEKFVLNTTYQITVQHLKDTQGNAITAVLQSSFIYKQQIENVQVIGSNLLDVLFQVTPNSTTSTALPNYAVDDGVGKPLAATVDTNNDKLYHLTFQKNFDDNKSLVLTVKDIKDTNGIYLFTPDWTFVYDTKSPQVNAIEVLTAKSLAVIFSEPVHKQSAESKENYQFSTIFPAKAELKQDSVILTFKEEFISEKIFTLTIDNVKDLSHNEIKTKIKKDFVYDTIPPRLDSILVKSAREVILYFHEKTNKATVESTDNYEIDHEVGVPVDATQDEEYQHIVMLSLATDLPILSGIKLTASNLADQRGNTMAENIITTMDFSVFQVSTLQLVSNKTIVVTFNKTPEITTTQTKTNYIISHNNPTTISFSSPRVAVLTFEDALQEDTQNTLEIINVKSSSNLPLTTNKFQIIFDSRLTKTKIVGTRAVQMTFDVQLKSKTYNLSAFTATPTLGVCVATSIDSDDSHILRLSFTHALASDTKYSIHYQGVESRYGTILPTHFGEVIDDRTSPVVQLDKVENIKTVRVKYSEPLNNISAEFEANYTLNPSNAIPNHAVYSVADSTVLLSFVDDFADATAYILTVNNIKDISNNALKNGKVKFKYNAPYIPVKGDLIITELLPDPSPMIGLPEVEYIELYNASDQPLDLTTVQLGDKTSAVTLSGILNKGAYVILTTSATGFKDVQVQVISSLPSLSNSADSIGLKNIAGTTIDFVSYSHDWYRDTAKDDGGYALERISKAEKCIPRLHWIASEDAKGGTPGLQNSVWEKSFDKIKPTVLLVKIENQQKLVVTFSEPMKVETLTADAFLISLAIKIDRILNTTQGTSQVSIKLESSLQTGVVYSLSFSDRITDCEGLALTPTSFQFGIGAIPQFNELIITEIMANPSPVVTNLFETEYIEIYNTSSHAIDLSSVRIVDSGGSATLQEGIIKSGAYILLVPSNVADKFLSLPVKGIANWRSLQNSGELLSLYQGETMIFSTNYSSQWFRDSAKANGGWSLEMIDTTNPCGEAHNWTASTSQNGGTPGMVNAVAQSNPDHFGPKFTNAVAIDKKTILCKLDEKTHPKALLPLSVSISPSLSVSSVSLLSPDFSTLAITLIDAMQESQPYQVTLLGLTDCRNQIIQKEFSSQEVLLAEEGRPNDLIINEILFNPRTGGVDFVELYNRSQKVINLKNWKLGDKYNAFKTITLDHVILKPQEYKVLTPDAKLLIGQYPKGKLLSFLEMKSFPSLADDQDSVMVSNEKNELIDQVYYSKDYHFGLLSDDNGVSLERVAFDAPSLATSSWQSAASTVGFATPGYLNSQFKKPNQSTAEVSINPKVFNPNNTGINDYTTINYQLDQSGNFANVSIYNTQGRLVKRLIEQALLSTSGFFTWDGINDRGNLAEVGYYIIVFEIFDGQGHKSIKKETVVLGTRF